MEKFRQESRVTASLAHPNVVTVHDFGVDANQRVFLVMELLEGITLREELRQKSRLTAERTLELFEGICAGIGAAHSRGLVHRDLRPENIFVSRPNVLEFVKITDFGIAKVLDEISSDANATATGVLVGTIRYMSPEHLQDKSMSPRWDIWALGVIGYESLCGTAPFVGTDYSTLASAILRATFPKITMLVPEAPDRWHEFFGHAFAPREEDRPQSVEEFWQELQECLG
jgi:eukaryotic-like serine/threonine-protein kinase